MRQGSWSQCCCIVSSDGVMVLESLVIKMHGSGSSGMILDCCLGCLIRRHQHVSSNDIIQVLADLPAWSIAPRQLIHLPVQSSVAMLNPSHPRTGKHPPPSPLSSRFLPPLLPAQVLQAHRPNIPPPPVAPPPCPIPLACASPCIFSPILMFVSMYLATQRSRQTDSPLLRSASR